MGIPVQTHRPLAVSTALGPDALLLVGLTGREAISQLFTFYLDLLAVNSRSVPFEQLLGTKVAVRLLMPGGQQRFFNGLCSRISQGERATDFTAYRMEVVPELWLLTRTAQSRIFQRKSVPDILKEVLNGLNVDFRLQGTFFPREFCVQYRETDFNFLSRLMEEEGIFYFFEHTADGHRLVLANTPQGYPDLPVRANLVFDPRTDAAMPEERVTAWQKSQELRAGQVTLWDHHFELPHKHLEATRAIQDGILAGTVMHKFKLPANSDLELFDWPGGYAHRFDGVDKGGADQAGELQKIFGDGPRTAAIRMQEEAVVGLAIEGKSDARQLTSGHKFKLTRHPHADGPYVVTAVEHVVAAAGDFRSGADPGVLYQNRFTCIPPGLPFRPLRRTPRPVVQGTQTAVVVGPPGEEIYPDKFGRVKVQFHWDRQGNHNLDSSCWVRVSQFWAGKRWGAMFIPRAGQEVLVDFLEGDPDRPVIIGSLYNAENMPAYELPKYKTLSYVKSDTSPGSKGFNELRFEDKKGKEQVFIHSQNRMDVRVRGSLFETNGGDRNELIGVRSDDKPGGNLAITVGGDHDLHVKGGMFVGIDKQLNVGVKGDVVQDYQGKLATVVTDKAELNAKEVTIEGLTKISLKVGGSFLTIDLSGVTISGPVVKINSGGAAVSTGPATIDDPLDADAADTGEPGYLDRPHGGGRRTRNRRTLNGQHAPPFAVTTLPNGDLKVGNNITVRNDPSDPTFQNKVLRDLTQMTNEPTGMQTLNDLNGAGQPVAIQHTSVPGGNATTPANPQAGSAPGKPALGGGTGTGGGTGSTIDYNPDFEPPTAADPTINRPSDVGLNHELTHADHFAHGNGDFSPDPAHPNNPSKEETETINTDNQYRSERVLPDGRTVPPRADHTVF